LLPLAFDFIGAWNIHVDLLLLMSVQMKPEICKGETPGGFIECTLKASVHAVGALPILAADIKSRSRAFTPGLACRCAAFVLPSI
jgi:hypothetical protein